MSVNNYGMTPEQASREFDGLRREATKLERALEEKLARYQQVRDARSEIIEVHLVVYCLMSPLAPARKQSWPRE